MGTLTSMLGIAQNTLQADQYALSTVANNVANQTTVGYTREIVNFTSTDTVTLAGTTFGTGVSTGSGAVSVRDRILEQRVQQQTQVQAQSGELETALNSLQNIFGISSTSTSAASTALGSSIDSFFNTFSALQANPSDTPTRQSVLNAASALTNAFNTAASQLSSNSATLNGQVPNIATQINTLTANIAQLNLQIQAQSPNKDAGILEDQRQASVAQLSTLIGLDQITTESNGISLTTSNGTVLVGDGVAYPLKTTQVAGVAHVLAGATSADVTSSITGGQLGGLLQARDQVLPGFASQLDTLAYTIASQVNTQNAAGLDGTGAPGGPIFALPTPAGTVPGSAAQLALAAGVSASSIAAAGPGEGATGTSNANLLAGIATGTAVAGQSPAAYYASFLGQLGTAVSAASSNNVVQQASLTQLTSQRDSFSGVSLDQEAASLTQYQRSYQAAAKVFSIVDQLLAGAINLGTETTVS